MYVHCTVTILTEERTLSQNTCAVLRTKKRKTEPENKEYEIEEYYK